MEVAVVNMFAADSKKFYLQKNDHLVVLQMY